jgi:hypothetical protein
MNKLDKNQISKLGHKINQLKKRISRTEISGNMEKVEFRKMRINKIKKKILEFSKKKK